MGVVYLAYCGSWQLSLHVPCFCAFYTVPVIIIETKVPVELAHFLQSTMASI